MDTFKFGDFEVICESQSTRSGFRHLATLYKNSIEIDETKICYLNRTWESFEFEIIINKLRDRNKEFQTAMNLVETEVKI